LPQPLFTCTIQPALKKEEQKNLELNYKTDKSFSARSLFKEPEDMNYELCKLLLTIFSTYLRIFFLLANMKIVFFAVSTFSFRIRNHPMGVRKCGHIKI
jgi:hypothetical protein